MKNSVFLIKHSSFKKNKQDKTQQKPVSNKLVVIRVPVILH